MHEKRKRRGYYQQTLALENSNCTENGQTYCLEDRPHGEKDTSPKTEKAETVTSRLL